MTTWILALSDVGFFEGALLGAALGGAILLLALCWMLARAVAKSFFEMMK